MTRPHVAVGALAALVLLAACGGTRALRERIAPAAPSERYAERLRAAGLDGSALGRDWAAAGERSSGTAAAVPSPWRERGYFGRDEARAAAYVVTLRRGQRLTLRVRARAAEPASLFVDVYRLGADSAAARERVAGLEVRTDAPAPADTAPLATADAEEATRYLVRLQPELLRAVEYDVALDVGPSLGFPVSGADARATQSFFGDSRDAGARRHEGVDIFARRGTPAVAAVDGVIRDVGLTRLGGKVVWLSDAAHGQSIYYAHLDTQMVRAGARVRAGDTLGLVGNTGNAITTPPHLHFGVYQRGQGAVDPFPFIDVPRAKAGALPDAALGGWRRVTAGGGASLATAPSGRPTARLLARLAPVRVDGAASGGWLRVHTADGAAGYVAARETEDAERAPLGRRTGGPVLERPAAAGVVVAPAAAELTVLGREGGYDFVRTAAGRVGWAARAAVGDR